MTAAGRLDVQFGKEASAGRRGPFVMGCKTSAEQERAGAAGNARENRLFDNRIIDDRAERPPTIRPAMIRPAMIDLSMSGADSARPLNK
ncbi:hypothetical protein BTW07_12890 [Salinicola socius]|uniref:Uncharacterized protein n=1 Tax=Salinicola socius TaxID=404433 RepID=A0A1Q8SQR4_9GAMM|nr:hypothetical protein BTW07_12890 [Salinicola socius]